MGYLLSHWKIIAGAVAVLTTFASGWVVNGKRWESKWNAALVQHDKDVAKVRAQQQADFDKQRRKDDAYRAAMAHDLTTMRVQNQELLVQLDSAKLVKQPKEVIRWRERTVSDGSCAPILANPFSDEFVRLYDASKSGRAGLPDANSS